MTDVGQSSDQADFPLGRDRDTLDSKPRNPTERLTRPLFPLFTPQTLSPLATTATEPRRNVYKPFEVAKETTDTTSIPGRGIISVLHGADGTSIPGPPEPFQT